MSPTELFNNNQALVHSVYHRYFYQYPLEQEELVQEGLLALWIAAQKYDPTAAKFSTVAHTYIFNAMRRYIRDQTTCIHLSAREYEKNNADVYHKARYYVSLDQDIDAGGDSDITLHESLGGEEDDYKGATRSLIHQFISTVDSPRDKQLLTDYYIAQIENIKLQQKDLSKKYKLSQNRVSSLIKDANKKFQKFVS